eukprot:Gb_08103 [translate_table: standard]
MGQGSMPNGDTRSPVLDRSGVRILLCDKDPKNSQQVLELLCKCSYQVTAVNTARQVIGVLNAEGLEIDLILAEVDLPKAKGFKMLKHIMREERLRRIPIVMMSAQDEVAIVVKCLKLGAADYLVKPLRINELLNLWIHMWRRRRMLGLAEKNIISRGLNHDLDLVVSDPSEDNTNSTTLFSDDTDDKKVRSCAGPEISTIATHRESRDSPRLELSLKRSSEVLLASPERSPWAGKFPSHPKKSELKVGESSAFLTYVKSSIQANKQNLSSLDENKASEQQATIPQKHTVLGLLSTEVGSAGPSHSTEPVRTSNQNDLISGKGDCLDRFGARSTNASVPSEHCRGQVAVSEQFSVVQTGAQNEGHGHVNVPGVSSLASSHFFPSGMLNHSLMTSSTHLYHGVPQDVGSHITPGLIPFHALPPCHGMPLTTAFPYYPYGLPVASAQFGPSHAWHPVTNVCFNEPKIGHMERREAALNKFRQKRKDRCFDKKIRYVSRKRLAEQRPRIRGQFVRQANDLELSANGIVDGVDDSEEEDGYGHGSNELGMESSSGNLAEEL